MERDTTARPLVDERRWRGANFTAIVGTSAVVAGALLLVAGWYGISGESVVARQLPYLASATVPGAALVVAGAVLLGPVLRGQGEETAAVDRLVELLTEPLPEEPAPSPPATSDESRLLAVPAGTHYHRGSCALVMGKPDAVALDGDAIDERGLQPCPACRPEVSAPTPTAREAPAAPARET